MSPSVTLLCLAVGVIGTLRWGRRVLADEDRYVEAVTNLLRSRAFTGLVGWSAGLVARHRPGATMTWRSARIVAVVTRRSLRGRTFGRAWTTGHRWLHRGRGPDVRVAAAMLVLAAVGDAAGVGRRLRDLTLRLASV